MCTITAFSFGSISRIFSLVGAGISYLLSLWVWLICIRDHVWSWCKVSFLRLCLTLSLCATVHTEGLYPHHLQQFHRYIVWLNWQSRPTISHVRCSIPANFRSLSVPNCAANLIGWAMKSSTTIVHSFSIAVGITTSLTSWLTLTLTVCLRVGTLSVAILLTQEL